MQIDIGQWQIRKRSGAVIRLGHRNTVAMVPRRAVTWGSAMLSSVGKVTVVDQS